MFRIKSLLFVLSWAVLLSGISSTAVLSLDEPSDGAVAVRVAARLHVARLGNAMRSNSTSIATLSLGESGELLVGAQNCAPFAGGLGKARAGSVVWYLSVALEEVDWDRFTLSYSWSREDFEPGAENRGATLEQGRIRLRHDESVPIDLARIRRPEGESCDVYVQLGADYAGSAEFRDRAARHEVWLTHTDPEGVETSTRLKLAGEQGEALGFLFDPLKLELPSADRDKEARVTARVFGHVRTWKTAEDRLLVVVDTETSIRSSVGTGYLGSSSNGEGAKRFHVRPGEAVKIVIPPLRGGLRLPGADPEDPLPAGLERHGDYIALDSEKAFGGHKLALVIQASVRD